MADKIDQLKFGNTSYDIDLPPDATPSIASLTASSKVEVKMGTSNNLGYAGLTTDLISTNRYEGAVKIEQGTDAILTKKIAGYYADRIVLRQGLNQPATFKLPSISFGTTKTLATTNDIKHVYKHTVTFKFLTNTFTGKYYSTSTTGISTVAELKSKLKGTYCSPYDSSTGYNGLVVYENQHNDSYVYGILFTERSDGSIGHYWTSDSGVSITSDSWEEV